MNCIKCGRETIGDQVFCTECQAVMEQYPVQPGTIVLLPNRKESVLRRSVPKRRTASLEDQVRILKTQVRNLTIGFFIAALLAALFAGPALKHLMEDHFEIGQNYTAVVSSTAPTDGD